jgi:signal transduction histidine kinase
MDLNTIKLLHDMKAPLSALKVLGARVNKEGQENRLLFATVSRLESLLSQCVEDGATLTELLPREVRNICEEIVQEKLVTTNVKIELIWRANEFRLGAKRIDVYRLIANLMGNAIAATQGLEGEVILHISQEKGQLVVEMSDNGRGFVERLQVPNERRGWGIGLMIVREIVDGCGGQIEFRERQGFGTRVLVKMPVALPYVAGYVSS